MVEFYRFLGPVNFSIMILIPFHGEKIPFRGESAKLQRMHKNCEIFTQISNIVVLFGLQRA